MTWKRVSLPPALRVSPPNPGRAERLDAPSCKTRDGRLWPSERSGERTELRASAKTIRSQPVPLPARAAWAGKEPMILLLVIAWIVLVHVGLLTLCRHIVRRRHYPFFVEARQACGKPSSYRHFLLLGLRLTLLRHFLAHLASSAIRFASYLKSSRRFQSGSGDLPVLLASDIWVSLHLPSSDCNVWKIIHNFPQAIFRSHVSEKEVLPV